MKLFHATEHLLPWLNQALCEAVSIALDFRLLPWLICPRDDQYCVRGCRSVTIRFSCMVRNTSMNCASMHRY